MRPARVLKCLAITIGCNIISRQRTTKALIRLCGCPGWSARLLFAYGINRFSRDVAQTRSYLRNSSYNICHKFIGFWHLADSFKWKVAQETCVPTNTFILQMFTSKDKLFVLRQGTCSTVKIPTREGNISDLFLTNDPGQVHATKTLPSLGSSDHDICLSWNFYSIGRLVQPEPKIKLFGKAIWVDINSFNESFQSENESDAYNLWNIFKAEIDPFTI